MKRFLENSAVLLVSIVMAAGLVYYALHPAAGTTPPNEAKGEQLEGAVLFTDAKIAASGIELQTAGPGTLQDSLLLNGVIQPNQETLVQVTPRFPGIVRDVRKRIGMKRVRLGPERRTVHYDVPGLEINLGSIGKGYALDRATELLRQRWSIHCGLLHGGHSSILALGSEPGARKGASALGRARCWPRWRAPARSCRCPACCGA